MGQPRIVVGILAASIAGSPTVGEAADCSCPGLVRDLRPYAGAALSHNTFADWAQTAHLDPGTYTSVSRDDRDAGFSALAGVGWSRYLALQATYSDFGTASRVAQSDGSGSVWAAGPVAEQARVDGWDLSLLGSLPVSAAVTLIGRVGYLAWKRTGRVSGNVQGSGPTQYETEKDGGDTLYGLALQYEVVPTLQLQVGWTRYQFEELAVVGDGRLSSTSASLAWRF